MNQYQEKIIWLLRHKPRLHNPGWEQLDFPSFLVISTEERRKAWAEYDTRKKQGAPL